MGLVKNALRRDVLVFVATVTVASMAAVVGPIGSAAAATIPSIGTNQNVTSAIVGATIGDQATVTGSSGGVSCPRTDEAGFSLGDTSDAGGVLFCSYPAFPGENPTDFFCDYSSSSGLLTTDNDAGFCPSSAGGGVSNPSGTVTFNLYSSATVQDGGTLLFTDTESLSAGAATSKGYATTSTGTYYWVATYNGDSNFSPVSSSASGEPVSIVQASPSISSSQQPATATVGSSVADRATMSGGYSPSGTVTFKLYSSSTVEDSGTLLFTYSESLSGGVATSKGYTTTSTGSDYWVATYNGDANNSSVVSGSSDEPVTVAQASPYLSSSQQPASAAVGYSIEDVAMLFGGDDPTGTVTFDLYSSATTQDSSTLLFTDTEPVTGVTTSSGFYTATATGTDYWVATYNGDANNISVVSGSSDAPVVVAKASPLISSSQQPASTTVGSSIADKATVKGGYSPSGTVTFNLYSSSTTQDSSTLLFSDSESLSGGVATSANYKTTAAGTDYWVATYNGDANNSSVGSSASGEPVTVAQASPLISSSQQPASATVGASIADKATVSGGYSPSGTVTFKLYSSASTQDAGTVLFSDTESLSGGVTTSAGYTTTSAATDYWVASYNGDSNNSSVSSAGSDEPVTVGKASPSISSSQQPASATVGASIADKATVSDGYSPSGTVTFKLYSSATTQDSSTLLFTDTESLSGGAATSSGYATTSTGTDYWVATYDGDSNNSSVSSAGSDEPVTVGKASPLIGSTQQPASATVGTSIADKATVSGGYDPTGTVTFDLYSSATTQNSSTLLFTDTETLLSGSATSKGYTTATATTLYWVANYNGDANNNSVVGDSASEPVGVALAPQEITGFNPPTSGVVGGNAVLSATGGGSGNPVTFGIDHATSPTDACVMSSSNPDEVVFVHVGTCVVDAFQAESALYSAGFASEAINVEPAATSTSVSYTNGVLSASVSAVAPGAGTPSGTVEFLTGGQLIGTGTLSSGTATLSYTVAAGAGEQVSATFEGTSDYSTSSSQAVTVSAAAVLVPEQVIDPSITATLRSAKPRSRTGWWTRPVTVVFHCNANGGELAGACPRSRTLTHSGKGQSVSQTVRTTSGGSATVHVNGINIDTTRPHIRLVGASARRLYTLTAPAARCLATDRFSGIRSCKLTEHRTRSAAGYQITYVARATSNAGTTASRGLTVRVTTIRLLGAKLTAMGVYEVTPGHAYRLEVISTTRPTYFNAAVAPEAPTPPQDRYFTRTGSIDGVPVWSTPINITTGFGRYPSWTIAIQLGSAHTAITLRT
jgi:hypothetical protein